MRATHGCSRTAAAGPVRGRGWTLLCCLACGVLAGGCRAPDQAPAQDLVPVTWQSAEQSLGEIPLFPGASLDAAATESARGDLRGIEKRARTAPGAVFQAVAVLQVPTPPEKVVEFYQERLRDGGWKATQTRAGPSQQQHFYQKGRDEALVQVQQGGAQTVLTLLRGSADLTKRAPQPQ